MLVWNAMPSTVDRISLTLCALPSMRCIVRVISSISSAALRATCAALPDRVSPRRQCSALRWDVSARCWMPAAVSSTEAACSSVRCDRLPCPSEMACEVATMASALARTCLTIRARLPFILMIAPHSRSASLLLESSPAAWRPESSSPDAMRSATRMIREMPKIMYA